MSKQSPPLGIKPTEPQLTAAIAHYLQAAGNQQQSRKRIEMFLRALLRGGCRRTNLLDAIEVLSEAQDIQVASEYRLGNSRKIDLLIRWKMPGGRSYVVAAEAKFGHQVTVGQLPTYCQQVKYMARGGDYALVLLTLEGFRSTRNKEWKPMTWNTLLTRLEKAATPDTDQDFILLKRLIWDKL